MSATEELRRLLDERRVEWEALSDQQEGDLTITATRWHDDEGGLLTMFISEPHGGTWDFFWFPTPEQAVAATLGDANATTARQDVGTCHMEYCEEWSGDELYPTEAYACSACGHITEDGKPNYCPNCGRRVVEVGE